MVIELKEQNVDITNYDTERKARLLKYGQILDRLGVKLYYDTDSESISYSDISHTESQAVRLAQNLILSLVIYDHRFSEEERNALRDALTESSKILETETAYTERILKDLNKRARKIGTRLMTDRLDRDHIVTYRRCRRGLTATNALEPQHGHYYKKWGFRVPDELEMLEKFIEHDEAIIAESERGK